MKDILMKSLFKYKGTRKILYSIIRRKNLEKNKFLLAESSRRKNISIFEFEKLAENIPNGYFHPNGDIQLYGFYHVLLQYIGKKCLPNNIAQEHGFIFSSFVHKHFTFADKILTFSEYREKYIINEYPSKRALKIGPYIHYAEALLNQRNYNDLKEKKGKILLVFPFHSIDGIFSDFDSGEFIEIIEEKRKGFDNVIICLYFKDIQLGRANVYIDKGYSVATAGHINDAFFLSRLKSIIQLSDYIISNGVGSHIAYAIYLNKYIELFRQKTTFCDEDGVENNVNKKSMVDIKKHWDEYELIQDVLFRILNGNAINSDDQEYLNDLFGFKHIKTSNELCHSLNI
nr:hypothetical protein [uncultured Flavobacterium sp.]